MAEANTRGLRRCRRFDRGITDRKDAVDTIPIEVKTCQQVNGFQQLDLCSRLVRRQVVFGSRIDIAVVLSCSGKILCWLSRLVFRVRTAVLAAATCIPVGNLPVGSVTTQDAPILVTIETHHHRHAAKHNADQKRSDARTTSRRPLGDFDGW